MKRKMLVYMICFSLLFSGVLITAESGAVERDESIEEVIEARENDSTSLEQEIVSQDDPIEIYDWNDLNSTRKNLTNDYILMNDLDENTSGYDEHVNKTENYEVEEYAGWRETWQENDTIDIHFDEEYFDSVLSVEDGDGNSIEFRVEDDQIIIEEDTLESYIYVIYENYKVGWDPIGDFDFDEDGIKNPFTGTFNGDGHEIRDLYINRPKTNHIGLFAATGSDGEVNNLGFGDANVTGDAVVGGLVGTNNGTIESTYNTGKVNGNWNVGGVIGINENEGIILNSYTTSKVNGGNRIGGLVGYNREGTVTNSYAAGDVSGESQLGGLTASNYGDVTDSFYHEEMPRCSAGQYESLPLDDDEFGSISTFETVGWAIEMVNTERDKPLLSWEEGGSDPTWYIKETEQTRDLTIDIEGGGETEPSEDTHTYYEHGKIILEASSYKDSYLINWTGDLESEEKTNTITMDENKSLTANFGDIRYEIRDWKDLYISRHDPEGDFTLMNDLGDNAEGYDDYGFKTVDYEISEYAGWNETWSKNDTIDIYFDDEDFDSVLSVEDEDGNSIEFTVEDDQIILEEDTLESYIYVTYENVIVGWDPIGNGWSGFNGTFDGNGNEIEDLYIFRPHASDVGLFGRLDEGAEVTDLELADVDVTGDRNVGGLVGSNHGTVLNSYATGEVDVDFWKAGGLVGSNSGSILNSRTDCEVTGGSRLGGLVGENDNGTVERSYSVGKVRGTGGAGGLIGSNTGSVNISYATGDVSTDGDLSSSVGGLIGRNGEWGVQGYIRNSYATGDVSADWNVGGLVGSNSIGTIENSYSTGSVDGDWNTGGLIGSNSDDNEEDAISNSFWDTETSGTETSEGGTGKDSSEMRELATYTDTSTEGLEQPWDFVDDPYDDEGERDIWNIDELGLTNDGYPYFNEITEKIQGYELTVEVEGEGTVNLDPSDGVYEEGTEVIVTVEPEEDWEFEEWTGTDETGEEIKIIMDEDKEITAHFEKDDEFEEEDDEKDEEEEETTSFNYWWFIIPIIIGIVIAIVLVMIWRNRKSPRYRSDQRFDEQKEKR